MKNKAPILVACAAIAAFAVVSPASSQVVTSRAVIDITADCSVTDVRLNGSAVCPTVPVTTTTVPPTTTPPTTAPPTSTTTTAPATTTTTTLAPTTTTRAPQVGFPDSSNTGVPDGVTLSTYTGPCTITVANTVIDAKTINCDLTIRASGVKVSRSRLGAISTDENSTGYSFTLTDSDVVLGNRSGTAVGAVNFTMTRVEVTGGNRSVNCWKQCNVTDSYVHAQFTDNTGKAHESGIRMGSDNVIRHNTIACDAPDVPPDAGCSADLTGYGDFAAVERVTVDNNLLKASTGGACAYGGSSGDDGAKPYGGAANNIRFTNNQFEKGPTGKCGSYFPITDFDSSRPGNVWSGNTWTTGGVIPPAN